MEQRIACFTIVVLDYDEAIEFYTTKLSFKILEDTAISATKRWVVLTPKANSSCNILLAKAKNETQKNTVGNQTGGRVFAFLYTDDFYRDYKDMKAKGVEFVRPPAEETYGIVSVFKDLYGNLWDFIQPKSEE